jgi:hypothetical protein
MGGHATERTWRLESTQHFTHTFALSGVDQAFSVFYQKSDYAMTVSIRP